MAAQLNAPPSSLSTRSSISQALHAAPQLAYDSICGMFSQGPSALFGDLAWPSSFRGWTLGAAVTVVSVSVAKCMIRMAVRRRSMRDAKTGEYPPGPRPLPLWGNVLGLRAAYYETLYDYVDHPASVFWIHATPFLVVNDEDALRRVLGGAGGVYCKPRYFGYRSKTVSSAVEAQKAQVAEESKVYDADGDASRAALDHVIRESFAKIELSVRDLLDCLCDGEADGEEAIAIVRRSFVALNLNILFGTNCAFGGLIAMDDMSLKPRDAAACADAVELARVVRDGVTIEDAQRVAEAIDFAGSEFARRMVNPTKVWYDIGNNVRFLRDSVALISLGSRLGRNMDAVQAGVNVSGGGTLAGVEWVKAWIHKVGRIGKLGKVVGLLMASTQTVPSTAVWLLHLLARHEDEKTKLVNELTANGITSIDELTYEKLDDLKYLDAVVREALRLYPPFPLIQRQAQQDDVLAGVTVPKDMIVYVVPWLVHRNPRFWADPHDFRPQRFIDHSPSHGDSPSDWTFLPFGRGARMCGGSRLALAQLKMVVIYAVLHFKWTSEDKRMLRDERFPDLGMVPRGIKIHMERTLKTEGQAQ